MIWSPWDYGWPYLCLGGGLVMFAVLFLSNVGRSQLAISRWRDPVWLAWLPVPMLMVHMFEEYGFDLLGRSNAFPATMCGLLHYPPYPDCPIPIAHYALLNLGCAWIGARKRTKVRVDGEGCLRSPSDRRRQTISRKSRS